MKAKLTLWRIRPPAEPPVPAELWGLAFNEWNDSDGIHRVDLPGMTLGSVITPTVTGWLNSGETDGEQYGWFSEVIYAGVSKAHKIDMLSGTPVASYELPSSNWTVQAKPLIDTAAGYAYFIGYDDQITNLWHVNRVRLSDGDVTTLAIPDSATWNNAGPEGATLDAANGFLYVNGYITSGTASNCIWKVDLSTFTIDSVHRIAGAFKTYGPGVIDGGYLLIPAFEQDGFNFYPALYRRRLSDDAEDGVRLNAGTVSNVAYNIALSEGFAYLSASVNGAEAGRVYKVDLSDLSVDDYIEFTGAGDARGLVVDDGYLYAAVNNYTSGRWAVVQIALGTFTVTDSLSDASWGTWAPWHLCRTPR